MSRDLAQNLVEPQASVLDPKQFILFNSDFDNISGILVCTLMIAACFTPVLACGNCGTQWKKNSKIKKNTSLMLTHCNDIEIKKDNNKFKELLFLLLLL